MAKAETKLINVQTESTSSAFSQQTETDGKDVLSSGEYNNASLLNDNLNTKDITFIREGVQFLGTDNVSLSGIGSTIEIAFTTPSSGTPVEFGLDVLSSRDFSIDFFEDSTFTGGTAFSVLNLNRNSSDTPNTVIVTDPTISDVGTLLPLDLDLLGGDAVTIGNGLDKPLILKNSTQYIVRITSNSGNNVITFTVNLREKE